MKCAAVAAWSAVLLVGVATAAYAAAQGDPSPPKRDEAKAAKSLEATFGKTLIAIDGSTIEIIASEGRISREIVTPTALCSAPTSSSSMPDSARLRMLVRRAACSASSGPPIPKCSFSMATARPRPWCPIPTAGSRSKCRRRRIQPTAPPGTPRGMSSASRTARRLCSNMRTA